MIKKLLILFTFLLLICSCKKDDDVIITLVDEGEKLCVTASNVPFDEYVVGFNIAEASHPKLTFAQYCPNNKNIPKLVGWKTTLMPSHGTYVVTGIVIEYDEKTKEFLWVTPLKGNQLQITMP